MEENDKTLRVDLDYFRGLTGDISVASEKEVVGIGKRIRSIREKKGLTLDQLFVKRQLIFITLPLTSKSSPGNYVSFNSK